ncbi:MAG: hypothetical protein AB7O65_09165 [Candidatus Korobacteraceae bacterium]
MSRTIDQIRESSVPPETMRAAAHGALPVSPAETIEILVLLTANPVFRKQARMTLAGWDVNSCLAVLSDPVTPREVLDYFLNADNRRPALLPALLENTQIPEADLMFIMQEPSHDVVSFALASPRVVASRSLLNALLGNSVLEPAEIERIRKLLDSQGDDSSATGRTYDYQDELDRYLLEHANEIAAEEGKAFELVKDPDESASGEGETEAALETVSVPGGTQHQADALIRLSSYQRIARMSVSERVQLAMKGSREDRYILIRDGSKVVSCAVLESPKLTEQEVEAYASMKNVQEAVLRGISGKRKFMKNYAVIRNLTSNPRCPLDVQLTLIKNLLNADLRNLSTNKNVADTVRKLALKMFKERTEKKH